MTWYLTGYNSYIPLISSIVISIIMVRTLYETKRSLCKELAIWVICLMLIFAGECLLEPWIDYITHESFSMFLSFIFLVAYYYLYPEIPWQQRTFTFIFINNTMYLILLLARTFTLLFGEVMTIPMANQLFLTIYLITASFFAISFALEIRPIILKCLDVYVEKINSMLIFAVINYSGALIIAKVWQPWHLPDLGLFFTSTAILCIQICGYIIAFSSLTGLGDKLISEAEARIAKEQLVLSEKYYDSIVETVNKTRVYNHNIRHFTNAVAALAEKRDFDGLEKFAQELKMELPESTHVWSRVAEIDAVIANCSEQCRENDIDFQCEFIYPRNIEIDTVHMCIMLGNCLQNAVDACKHLGAQDERYIKIYCFPTSDKLVIRVENTFDGTIIKDKEGNLLSRKEDYKELHGFGVTSIQQTAEKYHGHCSWEVEENIFKMNILTILKKPVV